MVWFECWRPANALAQSAQAKAPRARDHGHTSGLYDASFTRRTGSLLAGEDDVSETSSCFHVMAQNGDQVSAQGTVTLVCNSDELSDSGGPHTTPRALLRLVSGARLFELPPAAAAQLVTLDSERPDGLFERQSCPGAISQSSIKLSQRPSGMGLRLLAGGGSGTISSARCCNDASVETRAQQQQPSSSSLHFASGGVPSGAKRTASSCAQATVKSASGGGATASSTAHSCSLLPLHINEALIKKLGVPDTSAYGELLQLVLWQDDALLSMVRDICTALTAGHVRRAQHTLTSRPPTMSTTEWQQLRNVPLSIQSCYCRQADGTLQPALLFEHARRVECTGPASSGGSGPMMLANEGFSLESHADGASLGSRSMSLVPPALRIKATSVSYSDSCMAASSAGGAAAGDRQLQQHHQQQPGASTPGSSASGGRRPPPSRHTSFFSATGLTMPRQLTAPQPALGSSTPNSDAPDLMRGLAVLTHCPLVTLMDIDGNVLFQNAGSRRYWGSLVMSPLALRRGIKAVKTSQVLDKLFTLQPQWREAARADVAAGQKWRRVLEVPASARRAMHALMRPSLLSDGATGALGAGLGGGAGGLGGGGVGGMVAAFVEGGLVTEDLVRPQSQPTVSFAKRNTTGGAVGGVGGSSGNGRGSNGRHSLPVASFRSALKNVTMSSRAEVGNSDVSVREVDSPVTPSDMVLFAAYDMAEEILPGSPAGRNDQPLGFSPARRKSDGCAHYSSGAGQQYNNSPQQYNGMLQCSGSPQQRGGSEMGCVDNPTFIDPLKLRQVTPLSVRIAGPDFVMDSPPLAPQSKARRLSALGANEMVHRQYSALMTPESAGQNRQYSSAYTLGSPSGDTSQQGGRQRRVSVDARDARSMASQVMSRAPSNHVMAFVTKAAASSDREGHSLGRNGSLPRLNSGGRSVQEDLLDAFEDSMIDFGEIGSSLGLSINDVGGDSAEEEVAWHELQLTMIHDPVSGTEVLLLLQEDVTQRAVLEHHLSALMEAQFSMMEQMFPRHAMEYLMENDLRTVPENLGQLAKMHETVTILFTDIVGFTSMSKAVSPAQVMDLLNNLFTLFDKLAAEYSVYKVETAGDCYIVAGGLMEQDHDGFTCVAGHDSHPARSAQRVMAFAKALQLHSRSVLMPHDGSPVQVRVGIHTGPVVTGVIGLKLPKFSVFGTTMNTASRMESTCPVGCVQFSETTMELLKDDALEATGGVEVKGLGMMSTYLWRAPTSETEIAATLATLTAVKLEACHSGRSQFSSAVADEPSAAYGLGNEPSNLSCSSVRSSDGFVVPSGPSRCMKAMETLRNWRMRALTADPVAALGDHAEGGGGGGKGGAGGGGGGEVDSTSQLVLKRWALAAGVVPSSSLGSNAGGRAHSAGRRAVAIEAPLTV